MMRPVAGSTPPQKERGAVSARTGPSIVPVCSGKSGSARIRPSLRSLHRDGRIQQPPRIPPCWHSARHSPCCPAHNARISPNWWREHPPFPPASASPQCRYRRQASHPHRSAPAVRAGQREQRMPARAGIEGPCDSPTFEPSRTSRNSSAEQCGEPIATASIALDWVVESPPRAFASRSA